MDSKVNKRPLLQEIDSDSDSQNEILEENAEPIFFHAVDQKPLFRPHEPVDKFYMCYMIFYLLGITSLLPWNFFITANDYWMYKFRNTTDNNTNVNAYTEGKLLLQSAFVNSAPEGKTLLQKEFTSYLSIASAIPNTIFLILSTFINQKISLQVRMVGSLAITIGFFILSTVMVNVNTDKWQYEFFILTLAIVVILNVACAILSGSIFGIVGKFSPAYISAVISGQALGGIFTAIVQIISLASGESSLHSAFMYFMIGNFVLVLTLILYVILSKSVYFQYHINLKSTDDDDTAVSVQRQPRSETLNYGKILSKIKVYGISEWLVFVITLSIYPGVTVLVESETKGTGSKWGDLYFVPVVSYLIFSSGDYVGRLLAGFFQWPQEKGLLILALNFTRFAFIPLLLLCNEQPRHHLPVLIRDDIYYIIIMVLFALSNGYLANIAVIMAPKTVDHHEREVASSMMAAFLGIGLSLGSVLSLLMVKLI